MPQIVIDVNRNKVQLLEKLLIIYGITPMPPMNWGNMRRKFENISNLKNPTPSEIRRNAEARKLKPFFTVR